MLKGERGRKTLEREGTRCRFSRKSAFTKVRDDADEGITAPTPTVMKFAAFRQSCFCNIYISVYRMNSELAFLSWERGHFKLRGTAHFVSAVFDFLQYTIVDISVEIFCFAEHTIVETVSKKSFSLKVPLQSYTQAFCLGFHAFAIHLLVKRKRAIFQLT